MGDEALATQLGWRVAA